MSTQRDDVQRHLLWVLIAIGVLALAAAGAAAIVLLPDESAGPEEGVTLEQVVENPERYVGDTVTVSGDVAATSHKPRGFALGDDLNDTALVLPAPGARVATWPDPNDVARVTGTVRIYTAGYARERDDLAALGDHAFLEAFEGDAMFLARDVEILEEGTVSPVSPDDAPLGEP